MTQHFGLGRTEAIDQITILWPSGLVETRTDVAIDRRVEAVEGSWAD
jgi:hypothetical protein